MVERTIGDLVDAEARATRDTLIAHGRPVRHIQLPDTDEAIVVPFDAFLCWKPL